MWVAEWFREMGGRLGLVRFVSTEVGSAPRKVVMRSLTLQELEAEVQAQDLRAMAQGPAELTRPFEQVYQAAGVAAPEHGWTVLRLAEWLRAEVDLKAPRETVQSAILHKLASNNAKVEDVVRDAVMRDRALDAYAESVEGKLKGRAGEHERRAAEIEKEIRDLQAQLGRVRDETKQDAAQWRDWHARKVAAEKEMAWALSFLVEKSVVSVDEGPPAKIE